MTKEECRVCLREPRGKTSCDCGSKNKNQEKKKGFWTSTYKIGLGTGSKTSPGTGFRVGNHLESVPGPV